LEERGYGAWCVGLKDLMVGAHVFTKFERGGAGNTDFAALYDVALGFDSFLF
jgi:hypothetical protein